MAGAILFVSTVLATDQHGPAFGRVPNSRIDVRSCESYTSPISTLTATPTPGPIVVFDTLAPDNTYYPCGGYTVGIVPFKGLLEIASQFVAGASGNLATVDLGLLYFSGFQALPVNVYL